MRVAGARLVVLAAYAIAAPAAIADTLYLADGRILRGTVTEEPGRYKLAVAGGASFIPRGEVLRLAGGPAARAEFEKRRTTTPPVDGAAHVALARAAETAGLDGEARAAWQAALGADPTLLEPLERLSALTVADVCYRLAQAAPDDRGALVTELRPHGERGVAGLSRAFDERLTLAREYLVERGGAAQLSDKIRQSFKAARAAVLSTVHRHDYKGLGVSSSEAKRVAELAERVLALAKDRDLATALGTDPVLDRHLAALRAFTEAMKELDAPAEAAEAQIASLVEALRASVAAADLFPEGRDRAAENAAVREWNASHQDGLTPLEREGIEAVNWYREIMGLRLLRVNAHLMESSRGHTQEMLARGFFAHVSPKPGHRNPEDRVAKAGYPLRTVGENLAQQSGAPLDGWGALRAWIISPPHHSNMLETFWIDIGICGRNNTWTLNMGVPAR